MILFIDTETTGLPAYRGAQATDVKAWPYIVQLGWVMTDRWGNELASRSELVRPEGYRVPAEATRIHGISDARARARGVPVDALLNDLAKCASESQVLVAHNMAFDLPVVEAAFYRKGHRRSPLDDLFKECTMRAAARAYGGRWPTLAGLYEELFGQLPEKQHDALADARACQRIFFELWDEGHLAIAGPSPANYTREDWLDDCSLFDAIYDRASECDWFDSSQFVDSVYGYFEKRMYISDNQRAALQGVLERLE